MIICLNTAKSQMSVSFLKQELRMFGAVRKQLIKSDGICSPLLHPVMNKFVQEGASGRLVSRSKSKHLLDDLHAFAELGLRRINPEKQYQSGERMFPGSELIPFCEDLKTMCSTQLKNYAV